MMKTEDGAQDKMKLLKDKFSKKIFGFKIIFFHYTFQYAFGKFGLYDSRQCKWINDYEKRN